MYLIHTYMSYPHTYSYILYTHTYIYSMYLLGSVVWRKLIDKTLNETMHAKQHGSCTYQEVHK